MLSVFLGGCFIFDDNNDDGGGGGPSHEGQLPAPQNLTFDVETSTLSWGAVANAEGYKVNYNGQESETTQTQLLINITAQENEFKVQAIGDGFIYSTSNWSQVYTYTIPTQQMSIYEKINIKIGQDLAENDFTLVKIIGISYISETKNANRENIIFQTISIKDNKTYNTAISYQFEDAIDLVEALENFDSATVRFTPKKSIVDYNSAQRYIGSGEYDGQMQALKNSGYTFSVIDSAVREGSKVGSKFRFEIVMTCKAERGTDVKYFTGIYRVDILNPSSNPENNYVYNIMEPSYRTVTETEFVLHEQGEPSWAYMQDWVQLKDTAN